MFDMIVNNSPQKEAGIFGLWSIMIIISLLYCPAAQAQLPYWVPFASSPYGYYGRNMFGSVLGSPFLETFSFPPVIRQSSFVDGWYGLDFNSRNFRLAMPAPRPVIRQAAATISILITQGPTQALIVYNPTLLFGTSAVPVPTALTLPALLGGKPLIFGTSPITSANLPVLNYVANSLLLPSGLAFYVLP